MTSPWPYLKLQQTQMTLMRLLLLPEQLNPINQFIQSIFSFIVLYREKSSEKPQKSIFYVKENKFISKLSLFFDNYVVFTVIFVISRNLRSFNRNFR